MKHLIQLSLIRTVATVLCVAALSMPAHAVTSGGGASGGGDKSGGRGGNASHSGSDRNDIAKVTKAKAATTQLAPNVSVSTHLAPSGSFNVTAPNRGFNVTTVPGGSFNVTAAPRTPRTAPVVSVQAPSLTADSCAKPAHLNNELTCELTTHRE